jgi:chromosome segregation ATPase
MARPGVGAERIAETIKQLETEGIEPTVTAIRDRLGSGSFSTIGVVLTDWRQSRAKEARPAVPEPSDSVRALFNQLWAEAWTGALKVHEPERQAFARERQEYEQGKEEMLSEIGRLEAEIDSEKSQAKKAVTELTTQRDQYRGEFDKIRAMLAEAHGALAETHKRIEEEEGRNRKLASEVAKEKAQTAQVQTELSSLKKERQTENDRALRFAETLTVERDQLRQELLTDKTRIAEAQGALSEAKDRVKREEERNRELSERVIQEAARAQALAARLKEMEKTSSLVVRT